MKESDAKVRSEGPGRAEIVLSGEALRRIADAEYVGPLNIEGVEVHVTLDFDDFEETEVDFDGE